MKRRTRNSSTNTRTMKTKNSRSSRLRPQALLQPGTNFTTEDTEITEREKHSQNEKFRLDDESLSICIS
jgi:hypothetical protein